MMVHVECDFCGADDATLVLQATDTNYHFDGVFNVVRCRRCDLVYLNPRPDEDAISIYYPDTDYTCFKTEREPSGFGQNHPFVRVTTDLGIGRRLCDVGCGTGDFLVAAQRSGWEVAGVEINDYARSLCRERLGERVVFSSLEGAGSPGEPFDVVTLWHVLEHLPSPRRALAEIHGLLKPGGLLALAVPNFGCLERRIWGANWNAISAPIHFHHFTEATLVRYVQTCGYQVLCVHQQPGADSMASNLLRSGRTLFLDPFAKKDRHVHITHTPEPSAQSPRRREASYCKVGQQTKDRVRRITTKLVYPAAWLIARLRLGPELMLYARRIETAS